MVGPYLKSIKSISLTVMFLLGVLCVTAAVRMASAASDPLWEDTQPKSIRSYLGVGVVDLDAGRASAHGLREEQGVEVMRVLEGSPAEKGGLKKGDVLLSYNGEPILGGQQLGRLVSETPPNRHVKLQYWRDGKSQTTTVLIAEQPKSDFDPADQLKQLRDQFPGFSMPADIPTPLVIWRNRSLGIDCEPLGSQLAEYFGVQHGILVRFVAKSSAAEKAGIRSGDVLTSLGARSLSDPRDLSQCIRTQTGNKQVQISLVRDHKTIVLRVDLPTGPQE
jgi:serine protease Do